ncbi:MAG: hypothetical protein Q8O59_03425 [bacterium]|nr:hypothetical protein [bacterium]
MERKEGEGMKVIREEDGTNAIKVMVESNNQICLDALNSLAGHLKESGTVTSGSRVNHNGGYLIHFFCGKGLLENLSSIETVVIKHDDHARIIINHCPKTING